jgi:hypothetical protein
MRFIETAKQFALNLPYWHTIKKIIVFESDDWGMIRTSSQKAFQELARAYPLKSCGYSRNDSLERGQDVERLLEVLFENKNRAEVNNLPKFTLNYVTHNPDFEAIKSSDFIQYYRETSSRTYTKYASSNNVVSLLANGIEENVFTPQYHATEHVNINTWMTDLRNGLKATHLAFNYQMANLHKALIQVPKRIGMQSTIKVDYNIP